MFQRTSFVHEGVCLPPSLLLVFGFVAVAACGAHAAEPAVAAELPRAEHSTSGWDVAAEGQLGLSLQRLGMLADLKLRAKRTLYLSDSEFFHDNFLSVGLATQLSPVFAHAGVQLDVQPASFIKLSAGYHFVGYFGDDFRRLFAPTFEYRYSTAAGARYLQHDGDGLTFSVRER